MGEGDILAAKGDPGEEELPELEDLQSLFPFTLQIFSRDKKLIIILHRSPHQLSMNSLVPLRRRGVLLIVLISARVAPLAAARDCRLRLRCGGRRRRRRRWRRWRRIQSQAFRTLQKFSRSRSSFVVKLVNL